MLSSSSFQPEKCSSFAGALRIAWAASPTIRSGCATAGTKTPWIGSGVAGRPDHRQRDSEFAARGDVQPAELATRVHGVIEDSAAVIRSLTPARLAERTSVQGFDLTILEAVYHAVEHFSMHTGQILFATKLLTGQDLGYYRDLAALASTETVP
jgi:hypothetical protein